MDHALLDCFPTEFSDNKSAVKVMFYDCQNTHQEKDEHYPSIIRCTQGDEWKQHQKYNFQTKCHPAQGIGWFRNPVNIPNPVQRA
mmetsp:Transcript_15583/g.32785  ORF Transcript_15583/g.32785 Transcript_15583/m.32785 type:complete len:85 (-) Transcript_15583:450-704(-)